MKRQFEKITSSQNQKIKNILKLHDKKGRNQQQRFIIEGFREINFALKSNILFHEIYFCSKIKDSVEGMELLSVLEALCLESIEVSEMVYDKISLRENHEGLMVVGEVGYGEWDWEDKSLIEDKLILVVEKVEKPGNLGALIRTADAAGVGVVFVTDPVTDLFNPNLIRSSQGLVFKQKIILTDNKKIQSYFRTHHVRMMATSPHANKTYWDEDLKGTVAIVVGSESEGLSDEWLNMPDIQSVTIPMQGCADSLNVNAAATVVLFEALRQRLT